MKMEFKDWVLQKFLEWEKDTGHRQSFSAFARYLGVKTASLTQWRLGEYTPTGMNLLKIAEKLGNGVYGVLGYPIPNEPNLDSLPPRLKSALEESRDRIIEAGVAGDSKEAESILIETMAKFGYNLTSQHDDESVN
jgi:transcriptional regulator with XRE-family HTH domain